MNKQLRDVVALTCGGVAIYALGTLNGYEKGKKVGRVLGALEILQAAVNNKRQ